jgi:hypothetical protein
MTFNSWCDANFLDAIARKDFGNWLVVDQHGLDDRYIEEWWNLWALFVRDK